MVAEQTDFSFQISDAAAARIAELVQTEDAGAVLRISVDGGGCSGFQYKYEFTTEINDDDAAISNGGAKVVIDEVSREFLDKSQIDFVTTLGSSYFEIRNPNANSKCGCGNSFSI